MNIFILCGGNGKRMNDYSFPKPLNMINGKPLIYYTLANLPKEINELHFIVAPHLIKYNFNEIIINLFPHIKCHFYNLQFIISHFLIRIPHRTILHRHQFMLQLLFVTPY